MKKGKEKRRKITLKKGKNASPRPPQNYLSGKNESQKNEGEGEIIRVQNSYPWNLEYLYQSIIQTLHFWARNHLSSKVEDGEKGFILLCTMYNRHYTIYAL